MSYFATIIAEEDIRSIARTGTFRGKTATDVYMLGRRITFNSSSVFQDVSNYLVGGQDAMNIPSSGTTLYLVSTSANDVAGSPGISKVRVVYLDANGDQQVSEKTLNGTTPVSIGSGYSFIQWMETSALGTGTVAAGDVTISSTNGAATEATTFSMIKAGGNRSLSGGYKVPTGHKAYIHHWYSSAVNQDMDTRLRATVFSDDRTLSAGIYHFQDTMYLALNTSLEKNGMYLECPAGSIVKVSTIPKATTGSPRIDAVVHLVVIAD